jgi:hypothetical protein
MRKEVIYSLRMSRELRDALKKAAKDESRTVASLLDKIIKDYLSQKGLLSQLDGVKDQRWFTRKEIYKPATIFVETRSKQKKVEIVVLNISLGGVLIGYPKKTDVSFSADQIPRFELCMDLPEEKQSLCFSCEASRMTDSGYGVQVAANFIDADPKDLTLLRSYLN